MEVIRTVLGDIDPAMLGATDYHEHLFQVSPLLPGDELDDEQASLTEAVLLRRSGFSAMVDATPLGLGRDAVGIAHISAAAGLQVVATTGRHREAHYAPGHPLRAWDAETLADTFVSDIRDGMPATEGDGAPAVGPSGAPARAGLLKAGIGYWSISDFERTTLDAVALAQRITGAPVMVHLEFCTAAHEVLDMLAAGGVSAERVILAHADRDPDAALHVQLASRGAYLGYDGMARPRTRSDVELVELTARVVDAGAGEHILLGGDVARRTRYVAYGGMPGLAYLGDRYLPRLRDRLGADAVRLMTVDNPARALALRTPVSPSEQVP